MDNYCFTRDREKIYLMYNLVGKKIIFNFQFCIFN